MVRWLLAALFGALALASAAAAQPLPEICAADGDGFSADEFTALMRRSGAAFIRSPQHGYLPLGNTVTIRFPDETTPRIYHAYVRATDAPERRPAALPIESVVRDGQNTDVNVGLSFSPASSPESDTLPPQRVGRYTILITGCAAPATGGAATEPPVFGVVTREITAALNGWVWAAAASALLLAGIGIAVAWNAREAGGAWKSFLYIFSNYRSTVSLSSFQLFVFFSAVFITVAYCFGRRWQLTDLSQGVLYLLGISAGGAVAGAWGDASKDRLSWENWRWLDRRGAFPKALKDVDLNLGQLVTTRGEFDMYRFQALLFTLLVAPTFVITSVYTLGEASVPAGILAVLGLSQVTYLAGKMTGVPTIGDFDRQLSELRKGLVDGKVLDAAAFRQLREDFRVAMGREWADPRQASIEGDIVADTGATAEAATFADGAAARATEAEALAQRVGASTAATEDQKVEAGAAAARARAAATEARDAGAAAAATTATDAERTARARAAANAMARAELAAADARSIVTRVTP